jgi:thioredoxin-related protein
MLKSLSKIFLFILIAQNLLFAREINIDSLIKEAAVSSKHLFVWLHKTDCGYCDSMKEFTLDDDTVKDFVDKRFVFLHINIYEKDSVYYKDFKGDGRSFAKLVGYNFYPTSLFFNDKGKLIYAAPGYQDEKIFFTILNYIDSKSYEKMEFEVFENKLDFEKEL